MMLQRALLIVRRITGRIRLLPAVIVMMIMASVLMQVHRGEHLAGIRREGAHLEASPSTQHKQPYENTPHQWPGSSVQKAMDTSKNPAAKIQDFKSGISSLDALSPD